MTFSIIKFSISNGVATIGLNRPGKLNSINTEMAIELQNAIDYCMENNEVRCLLLIGEGRAFCAGQDLEEAISGDANIEEHVENKYNPLVRKIRAIEKPVIAAVNGVAAGAGANLAFCCDIVVASESARFIQSFVNIGLIPDTGGTFFLPRLVGFHRAASMMMLGEKVSAIQAKEIGLVYAIYTDKDFTEQSKALALHMAKMPTRGVGLTKKALNYALSNTLNEQLAVEKELQGQAGRTLDNVEGINAFLEKRKPIFNGK